MICNNCGKDNAENAKLCEDCGSALEPEQTVPAAEETPAVEDAPKKKKGVNLLAIIIAVLVVLAALGAAVFGFGGSLFVRFSSPEKQQLYAYDRLADKVIDVYGEMMAVGGENEAAGSGELSLTLSDTAKALISDMGIDLSDMDSISIGYDADVTKDIMSLDLTASYNGTELIAGEMVMDTANGVITASVPSLNQQSVKIDMAELMGTDVQSSAVSDLNELLPEEVLVEKLLPKYIETVLKNVTGVEKTSEDLTVNGVAQKATLFTTELTEKMMADISLEVAKELKADEELKAYIIATVDSVNETEDTGLSGEESYKEFTRSLDEFIADTEAAELTDEVAFTLKTWVDSSYDILAVEADAEADGENISLFAGTAVDNEKIETEITVGDGTEEYFKLTCSGTQKRDVYSGTVRFYADGEEMFVAECEDIDVTQDHFVGKITLTSEMLAAELDSSLAGMAALNIEGKTEGDKNIIILAIGTGDAEVLTLTADYTEHEFEAPKLHDGATEDLEAWAAEIDTEALMTKLTNSGLMDIVTAIMSAYYYEDSYYPDDEYYDDDYYADYTEYDYGYDAGYLDGYYDGLYEDYMACYGENAELDTADYTDGYAVGYEDGYADGVIDSEYVEEDITL